MFERNAPLPPAGSAADAGSVNESKNGLSVAVRFATWTRFLNFTQRGGLLPGAVAEAGTGGPSAADTASLTPGTGGFEKPAHAESAGRPPPGEACSSVTVGSPTPPVSSRPRSGV